MSVFVFVVFLFFPFELVSSGPPYAELPSRITALSGACVQIPCKFNVIENISTNTKNIFGIWIKKIPAFLKPESLVVYNGSTQIKGFSYIEMLGNLSQLECTTVFYNLMKNHSDNYYFRVEIKPQDWNYTYAENPINISVSDVPAPIIFKPTNLQETLEEATVNLSCSAEAPCPKQPPQISWSYIPESAQITTQLQENPDKTQSMFSNMTFKASYKDHRKNISCIAAYPRNTPNDKTVESTVMLQVLFAPKETRIIVEPSDSVSVGTNMTLTCKSKASPSKGMNYSWFKRGQEKQLDFGEQVNFIANRMSGGWYICSAENRYGKQESGEIQLIVAESLSLIIGCIVGVTAFVVIFLLLTLFLRLQRIKSSIIRETDISDQVQEKHMPVSSVYANSAFMTGEELEMQLEENDTVHYGEIDFSSDQRKSVTVKSSGEETIYAEVCDTGKENNQD